MSVERDAMSRNRHDEETAAEFTPNLQVPAATRPDWDTDGEINPPLREIQEGMGGGTVIGVVGLVLSLLSLFTLPFLLSLIGIAAGFIAARRGATSLGRWSIGIGVISMVGAMIFAPLLG